MINQLITSKLDLFVDGHWVGFSKYIIYKSLHNSNTRMYMLIVVSAHL